MSALKTNFNCAQADYFFILKFSPPSHISNSIKVNNSRMVKVYQGGADSGADLGQNLGD